MANVTMTLRDFPADVKSELQIAQIKVGRHLGAQLNLTTITTILVQLGLAQLKRTDYKIQVAKEREVAVASKSAQVEPKPPKKRVIPHDVPDHADGITADEIPVGF